VTTSARLLNFVAQESANMALSLTTLIRRRYHVVDRVCKDHRKHNLKPRSPAMGEWEVCGHPSGLSKLFATPNWNGLSPDELLMQSDVFSASRWSNRQ